MEGKANDTYSQLLGDDMPTSQGGTRADMSRHAVGAVQLQDMDVKPVPWASAILSKLCCPLVFCNSCYTLESRTEAVIFHMGVLTGVEQRPGLHWITPFGANVRRVSTTNRTMELPNLKVADKRGNPVLVSAILNYRVTDAKRAILNVANVDTYIRTNAQAVLKQVVSQYTYDELKSDSEGVNRKMFDQMAPLVQVAGVYVERMALNDLAYAPEVAAAMLKKQQAYALIEARKLIVTGAVTIAKDAVRLLEDDGDQGLQLTTDQKVKIVTNLLTVTCAESDTTPTVNLS